MFSDNAKIIGRGNFQAKFLYGAIAQKRLKTIDLDRYNHTVLQYL